MIEKTGAAGPQSIRIDGDALWHASPEVHRAAEVLLAYLAGLDEGRRSALAERRPARTLPARLPVPATAEGEAPGDDDPGARDAVPATLANLEAHAEAVHAQELNSPEPPGQANIVCGSVMFGPQQNLTQVAPSSDPSSRPVFLVWGPGAADALSPA